MMEIKELYWDVSERVCEEMDLPRDVKEYLHNEIDLKSCREEAVNSVREAKKEIERIKSYQKEIERLPEESRLKNLLKRGNSSIKEFLTLYEDLSSEKSAIEREIGKLTGEINPVLLELYNKILKEEDLSQSQRERILDSMNAYKEKYERRRKELEKNPKLKKRLEELISKKEMIERELNCIAAIMELPARIMNCGISGVEASYAFKMEMEGGACTYGQNIRYSGLIESTKDENKLRTALGAEIGHKIAEYFVKKDKLCVSVNEFYDILGAYCSGSPYPEEVIKENAILGELSLNGVDITSEDKVKKILGKEFEENRERYKRWIRDAQDYVARHGRPGHQEGAALFLRLAKVFGDNLPKIAGKALRNPKIDFSNPNSFYESVIKEYRGDEK